VVVIRICVHVFLPSRICQNCFFSAFFLLLFSVRIRSALYFQPYMNIRNTYKLHLNYSMCSWAFGGAHILSLSASLRLLSKSIFFSCFHLMKMVFQGSLTFIVHIERVHMVHVPNVRLILNELNK